LLVGTGTSPVHPSLIASDDGVSFKISSNIIVGSATGGASGAMGPGTLNVAGGYYVNGVAIGGTAVAVSDTPPATPAQGNQWWDSVGGQLYVYVNDGTSSQWVAATNVPLAPNVTMPLTANAVLVGNGSNPVVASAITSDNGSTLRVTTNAVIGNAVTSPPSHALVVNNAASTPQATSPGPLIWAASETGGPGILVDSYGAISANLTLRKSRGTAAAPSAVQSGDVVSNIIITGMGATTYAAGALITTSAMENWSETARGSHLAFATNSLGSITNTYRMTIGPQGVVIGNPAGDPGQGGLVLNANATAPQPATAGTLLQVANVDGTGPQMLLDAYGGLPIEVIRRASGSAAAPSAIVSGSNLGQVQFQAYGVGGYNIGAGIMALAVDTFSGTAAGTSLRLQTCAPGTTLLNDRLRLTQGLQVCDAGGIPAADMGVGTINVPASGSYYINGANIGAGHLPGTQTNDNAAAGQVGEYISSIRGSGSGLTIASAAVVNLTTISLTPGDWDVAGELTLVTNGSTLIQAGISTASAVMPNGPADNTSLSVAQATTAILFNTVLALAPCRMSFTTTTTVYLVASQTGGGATPAGFGKLRARRMR
jgi:hypothetical protein